MSLIITSLNSGSNGNSYYVGHGKEAVLVDAGLSCKETERRLMHLNLSIRNVKAIFISHEHADHIKGIEVIVSRYGIPCYATPATLSHISKPAIADYFHPLEPEMGISIGPLRVIPFPKYHDAADPQSFIISHTPSGVTAGVFTDIGRACERVIKYFKRCHAAFLESNYDEEMLMNGKYPFYLKQRIAGDHGHLSNEQALDLFKSHKPDFMSHLFLAHLSAENNCPVKAKKLFEPHAGRTLVEIAPRTAALPVYEINHQGIAAPTGKSCPASEQLKLF